ncbi:DUF3526 domain-containing protein [Methylotenera sp.]|uniref:ABC transporter permease n=1 Tax=Methylotenera sp. TaxID=2051956 RepID=UPI0027171C67|nr:DUF3526 domain-containing protein [Methylotenera sp.]MDO9205369.1 DUF3526 domain-containing protein [Methylotenera sp.]MDP1523130.1 DUF3526 domain-containing protein [Methylotenera sp.]MDP3307539.1 DUF3526 domain-containing protein [Methylotenera sp.]MDP3819414.1 DUF3526 domain-containing protein [Methylotenera sp.]
MFKTSLKIAQFEWIRLLRDSSSLNVIAGLLLVTLTALYLSHTRFQEIQHEHDIATVISNAQWNEQPERHPHRVSHFGDFVFKPLHPLFRFDEGGNAFTGYVLFLESHRQNSANFNDASESGALVRFGLLTPAFILQTILPLVLIFIGFSIVSSEREQGTLQQLLSNGVKTHQLVLGKLMALAIPSVMLVLMLSMIGMIAAPSEIDIYARITVLLAGYTVYLLMWCTLIIAVSSYCQYSHTALLTLVALWLAFCIALPRLSHELAHQQHPTPSLVEANFMAEDVLSKIGDSHNANDPYFNTFKEKSLQQYGVKKVEDLPVNYNGLLLREGERLTTQVYREQYQRIAMTMQQQQNMIRKLAWLNPSIAIQTLSRAASGSDLAHHMHFLELAEQRRYATIQYLNSIHIHQVKHANDKEQRLDADFWKKAPRKDLTPATIQLVFPDVLHTLFTLFSWLTFTALALIFATKRLSQTC